LTEPGRRVLLERGTVLLTHESPRPKSIPQAQRAANPGATAEVAATRDESALFEELRTLRKRLADERDVPAYVIFPDTTLRHMARELPRNSVELRRIPGVGDKKLSDYGPFFLEAIAAFGEFPGGASRQSDPSQDQ
jgi:ATP-dependent DNA helicase RecQ